MWRPTDGKAPCQSSGNKKNRSRTLVANDFASPFYDDTSTVSAILGTLAVVQVVQVVQVVSLVFLVVNALQANGKFALLGDKLNFVIERGIREDIRKFEGEESFALTPLILRSLGDLSIFVYNQRRLATGGDRKVPRSPETLDALYQKHGIKSSEVNRIRDKILSYIWKQKDKVREILRTYLSPKDRVLANAVLQRSGDAVDASALARAQDIMGASSSSSDQYARAISSLVLSKNQRQYLADGGVGDGAATAGMMLLAAAAGLPKPMHEIYLDCQACIKETGDGEVILTVGEIVTTKEAASQAVEQIELCLRLLETVLRADHETDDLNCIKVARLYMPKSTKYLPSIVLPESTTAGGTIIKQKYI